MFWSVREKCFFFLAIAFCKIDLWAVAIQCIFFSHFWVFSSWSFTSSIDEITNIVSESDKVSCPVFYDNCLLTLYSVQCNGCYVTNNNAAFYCTWSVSEPLVREIFFWGARTRKNLNFLRSILVFDLVLNFCSDRNEGIVVQVFFYFIVSTNIVASVVEVSFLYLCFKLKFSRISILWKRLQ